MMSVSDNEAGGEDGGEAFKRRCYKCVDNIRGGQVEAYMNVLCWR